MPVQRHVIRRQVFEVHCAEEALARPLQDRVRSLLAGQIVPVIERCLDAVSDGDYHNRIDRLEIDLGRIDAACLADELSRRLEARLPQSLRAAVRRQAAEQMLPPALPALALIVQFARTGGLPWWSDGRAGRIIQAAVEEAARTQPQQLAARLRELAADAGAIIRLVRHLDDGGAETLLRVMAPQAPALARPLLALLAPAPAAAGLAPDRLRQAMWREALRAAALAPGGDPETFLQTLLSGVAAIIEEPFALLVADLHEAVTRQPAALPPVAVPAALADALAALAAMITPARPEPVRDAHDDNLTAALLAAEPALAEAVAAPSAKAGPAARGASPFADADAIYVENAGLTLLWPFLPTFFANLGLLDDDKAFIGEAARHRAVGLLHLVATGEVEPPEYWLALNKVLCGMDLTAVHDFGAPAATAELGEAERLLAATLAYGTALGDLSPEELRRSFLLRRGALSTRDGAWLLRVERQAADDALEHLPWTMQWIKLPWMTAPLRIEW